MQTSVFYHLDVEKDERFVRRVLEYGLRQLARDAQVHPSQLSRFIRGVVGMDEAKFIRVCRALHWKLP